ncbi:histone-fold-containing protein [Russula earlei]|uniref:Histone-fold-containing protein n=2 Tax=Russula earlei TaxID=71964 RepID=A0ACC0TYM8_9AGAM|nr:histone-fold-containing protein [Russula earlei]KAI9453822.1 histone-fold-containing protein [Russula earlei]
MTKPYVQSGEPLHEFLHSFWQRQVDAAEQETPDYRHPPLPLARIKKVMKSDPDVKMIAADAPILFCKACEIFIAEITARAFIVADSNKRRTLSRADIAKALSKSDQFDFLIDIVPRDEPFVPGVSGPGKNAAKKTISGSTSVKRDPAAQDAQGETQGDPILEGGYYANIDGLPHSGTLEQLQTLLDSPMDRPPI